jgi:hypothetical protein
MLHCLRAARSRPGWRAAVAAWGRASFLSLALALLDAFHDLPLPWLTASQYRWWARVHSFALTDTHKISDQNTRCTRVLSLKDLASAILALDELMARTSGGNRSLVEGD